MATQAQIQTRLDAYLAAELEILSAQEMDKNGNRIRQTELDVVRKQIDKLELQLARTQNTDAGGGLRHSLVNMNKARM